VDAAPGGAVAELDSATGGHGVLMTKKPDNLPPLSVDGLLQALEALKQSAGQSVVLKPPLCFIVPADGNLAEVHRGMRAVAKDLVK
jgi:hypothetical protein